MRSLRLTLLPLAVVAGIAAVAERPAAWGFDAHRFVADRAIDLLPPAIRPFFVKHRAFIAEHSIDPDLWRTAGFTEEPPQHFLDLDAYGPPPFDALPRERDAAIAKFGRDMVLKNGQLPWRIEEMHGRLVRAFGDVKAERFYGRENVTFLSAVLAHYVGDAHVPFHAVLNYDGQLTGQHGLHSRFESQLFERYRKELRIRPVPMRLTATPRDFTFDTLVTSASLVDALLAADREAIGKGDVYDSAYYARFYAKARPTLERRLSEAIAATAALITHAWEAGGKPALPADAPPRPARRRQPAAQP